MIIQLLGDSEVRENKPVFLFPLILEVLLSATMYCGARICQTLCHPFYKVLSPNHPDSPARCYLMLWMIKLRLKEEKVTCLKSQCYKVVKMRFESRSVEQQKPVF